MKGAIAASLSLASGGMLSGCAQTSTDQVRQMAANDNGSQIYTLLYSSNNSSTAPIYKNVEHELLKRIQEASNGRIVIHEYLASALVKSGEGRNAILNDICDIVFDSPSWYNGVFPLSTLLEMPLGFKSGKALSYTFRDLIRTYKPAEFDGFKVLCPMCSGPRCLITNSPVRSIEDISGLQIRASATSAAIIRGWGGTPATIASSDIYEALQNNLVDGGLFSYESMVGSHYYDACDYITDMAPVSVNVVMYMSQAKFDALPADLQEIIESTLNNFFDEVGSCFWANYREDAVAEAQKGNASLEWITLDDDEIQRWVEKGNSVTQSYLAKADAAGYAGKEVLDWITATYQHYEQMFS